MVCATFKNGVRTASTRRDLKARIKALGKGHELKLAADANLEAIQVAQLIQEVSEAGVVKLAIVTLARTADEPVGK